MTKNIEYTRKTGLFYFMTDLWLLCFPYLIYVKSKMRTNIDFTMKTNIFYFAICGYAYPSISDIYEAKNTYKR